MWILYQTRHIRKPRMPSSIETRSATSIRNLFSATITSSFALVPSKQGIKIDVPRLNLRQLIW